MKRPHDIMRCLAHSVLWVLVVLACSFVICSMCADPLIASKEEQGTTFYCVFQELPGQPQTTDPLGSTKRGERGFLSRARGSGSIKKLRSRVHRLLLLCFRSLFVHASMGQVVREVNAKLSDRHSCAMGGNWRNSFAERASRSTHRSGASS